MAKRIQITDFTAQELDVYARFSEVQLLNRAEPEKGIFIAESPKVIQRALDAGCQPISFLAEERQTEGEAKKILERCMDVPVYVASYEVLRKLTGFPMTRGLLCAMYRPKLLKAETLLREMRRVAVLENVVNPTNVGAIFRSAAALGMDAVFLTYDCSDPLYRRAVRVSMGTVFQIPWTFFRKEEDYLLTLRQSGFSTVAMALTDKSIEIGDRRLMAEKKLAVILGTEGEGLSKQTISECDYTVKIPMFHGVDSLNVAAASAVAFYELGKREEEHGE